MNPDLPLRPVDAEPHSETMPVGPSYRPLGTWARELTIPAGIESRSSFRQWFGETVVTLMEEAVRDFGEGLKGVSGFNTAELDRITTSFWLLVHESIPNAVCYGLAGLTSEERLSALSLTEDPGIDQLVADRLTESSASPRTGAVSYLLFPDRIEFTIHDGTRFEDFAARWARAPEAVLEENLCRPCGRGLFLIQSSGFAAEQAPSGAITFTAKLSDLAAPPRD